MIDNNSFEKGIQYVKGVGPGRAKILERLGVKTVGDMLYYFPRDWMDRTNIKPINTVKPGERVTVKGVVAGGGTRRVKGSLRITTVMIQDGRGYISGVWYNQPYMEKVFKKGDTVIFHGKAEIFRGQYQVSTPEYEVLTGGGVINADRIVPIYPLTEKITQKQVRRIIKYCIDNYLDGARDVIPAEIRKKYSLTGLKNALSNAHFPGSFAELKAAKKRIIFGEFFYLQMALAIRRKRIKEKKGIIIKTGPGVRKELLSSLPFELTGAQKRVLEEIFGDFSSGRPMNRLLQGDVGSGKTAVALLAAAAASKSGFQAAMMAPTEILAAQHKRSVENLSAKIGPGHTLLLGGMKKSEREKALSETADGSAGLVIGTHALLQDDVVFKNLGLIIVDEQHRFGVMQRVALARKAKGYPHTLIMTATPIPRTLSLTAYGDTDVSVIDTMPPGRKPVKTMLFRADEKERLYGFVEKKLSAGEQVYAVYPLVSESENLDLKSAVEMEKEWALRFKNYRTALVHGRMKKKEKDAVMEGFKNRGINILVSTTVIEVGIDVPNASVMVVEHAERFGLSQLHQLRGRVGRGRAESYCALVGEPSTEEGMRRLSTMASTTDGFKISGEDLAIRGPGEFMGVRQHGLSEFKMGDLLRDRDIMESSKEAAGFVVSGKCDVDYGNKMEIMDIIKRKYSGKIDLINIG